MVRGAVQGGQTYAVRICFPECSAARHAAALEIVPDANRPNPIKRNWKATFCTASDCALPRVLSASGTEAKNAMSISHAPAPS